MRMRYLHGIWELKLVCVVNEYAIAIYPIDRTNLKNGSNVGDLKCN